MSEWHAMMVELARELVAKGNLEAWQIAERTGISVKTVERMMRGSR